MLWQNLREKSISFYLILACCYPVVKNLLFDNLTFWQIPMFCIVESIEHIKTCNLASSWNDHIASLCWVLGAQIELIYIRDSPTAVCGGTGLGVVDHFWLRNGEMGRARFYVFSMYNISSWIKKQGEAQKYQLWILITIKLITCTKCMGLILIVQHQLFKNVWIYYGTVALISDL